MKKVVQYAAGVLGAAALLVFGLQLSASATSSSGTINIQTDSGSARLVQTIADTNGPGFFKRTVIPLTQIVRMRFEYDSNANTCKMHFTYDLSSGGSTETHWLPTPTDKADCEASMQQILAEASLP